MNPLNAWKGKLEAASFLPSEYLYRQCVLSGRIVALINGHKRLMN